MAERHLTIAEKVEIVRLVGENVRSFREAAREFNRRHPQRRISFKSVADINNRFNDIGSVSKSRPQHLNNGRIDPAFDEIVLQVVRDNPRLSVRKIASQLEVSQSKVWRCLKRHKLKAFKPKFLHTLEEGDAINRLEYCLWTQGNFLNDRDFLKRIIYTDEATFTTNGIVSSQNCRWWALDNPAFTINCRRQYSQKVNVWCGILNDQIIGPFFFNNLNAQTFLDFLNTEFQDAIEELPVLLRRNLYLQLDGSSVHNAIVVRNWLNQNFPLRWIGRNSPLMFWPPRSPDITPLDFYLWGLLKQKVYKSDIQNREDLCNKIRQACREITQDELRKVVVNNRKRIEKCITLDGGLVERDKI